MATTVITQGIKVNAGVNASGSTNITLYTAPATGYAIVQLSFLGNASGSYAEVSVASRPVMRFFCSSVPSGVAPKVESTQTLSAGGASTGTPSVTVYVGPSQALSMTQSGGPTVYVTGVEFINF